jgi:limonene-1,2-epoxide hydrolase
VKVLSHVAWRRRGVLGAVHGGDVSLTGADNVEGSVFGSAKGLEPRPMPAHRGMRKPRAVLRVRSQKRMGVEVRVAAQEEERKIRA